MDRTISNFVVNNCEYTPVYLVQSPSGTQAEAIVITPCNQEVQKPTATNLKSFYENSGNLENGIIIQNVEKRAPNSLLKKRDSGNNLKLASFVVSSSDVIARPNLQIVNNKVAIKAAPIVSTPKNTPTSSNSNNTGPKINCNSKIVKIQTSVLSNIHNRPLPKMKPKHQPPPQPLPPVRAPSTYTSVQLLKLGETYHSLSNLDEHQMKIVNQALKNIKDPGKVPEPTYDPVTNTNIIYRVISTKDLAVVGNKNKLVIKSKKEMIKKDHIKKFQQQQEVVDEDDIEEPELCKETKFTRSGRQVKTPRLIVSEEMTQKHINKKRFGTTVSCTQCNMEFCSLYRLQRHYDMNPTHLPTKTHTDLFHCFCTIINSGDKEDRANIFVQQLEQLIDKLKSLLPCLLKKIDGSQGKQCTINDDIGRLFGMNPGKYNLNMDALSCIKDKDGYCKHNPKLFNSDLNKPSQIWLLNQNEDSVNSENESEDCARINSVEKLSSVTERIWKQRQKKNHKMRNKRIKLTEESQEKEIEQNGSMRCNCEHSELIQDNNMRKHNDVKVEEQLQIIDPIHQTLDELLISDSVSITDERPHVKFHSAHFDIRSSPIKPSATVFRKFQISPGNIGSNEVHILKPLTLDREISDSVNERDIPQNVSNKHTEDDILLSNGHTGQNILVSNEHLGQNILEINPNICNEQTEQSILEINPSICNATGQTILEINTNLCNENNTAPSILDINTRNISEQEQNILQLNTNTHFELPTLDIEEQKDVDIVNDFADVKDWVCNTEVTNSFLMSNFTGPIFVNTCKDQTMSSGIHENELTRTDSDLTLSNRTQSDQSDFNFLDTLGSDSLSYPEAEIRNSSDFHLDLFSFNTT